MKQILLWCEAQPSLENLSHIRSQLARHTQQLAIDEHLRQNLLLVATEYLTNLLRHQPQPAQKVRLRFFKERQQLWFEIIDNGSAWPEMESALRQAALPQIPVTGGMGLALIATLFADYHYVCNEGENSFTVKIPQQAKKHHVLLIDDSPSQLALLRGMLGKDYLLTTFSDPLEALIWLQENDCDLVVTDLHMPLMNGIEFRHKVGRLQRHALLPFIFLTGDSEQTTRDAAASQAIDDYLIKPIAKQPLITVLNRVLARHQHLECLYEQKLLAGLNPQFSEPDTTQLKAPWQMRLSMDPPHSGDFCLSREFDDGRTLLVLGDQMGHGPLARANGAAWQGFIQGLLQQEAATMGDIACKLNTELYQSSQRQPHLMCLAIIELNPSGNVKMINAGMPPPVVYHDGKASTIRQALGLLGIDQHTAIQPLELHLQAGDRLHIFSDGVCEASADLIAKTWPTALTEQHQHIWEYDGDTVVDDRSLLTIGL
uniref:SpoIIE family protein phosphatase n=1 Tax=Thaumasiovibrio occultus TaxID=1891184 RepID=UPI000B355CCA|nr:SpoIIE family protein phosphatase [Thaumasiovibrio occultus]